MAARELPPQARWPEYLFRVTSSLTWRRTPSTHFIFVSPVQQLFQPNEISLEQAFPGRSQFDDAVARHLKASHEIGTGGVFHTPFISTTTSFRYALSVAELHYRRGGADITIAIIDTTLLERRMPVWDADQVASLIHLASFKGDFKDEFLVFGSIAASELSFKTVHYLDLIYKLGSFIPSLLDKQDDKRSRFSTFWKDLPKKKTAFTTSEASSAFQIARFMAKGRTMIPLMAMVLCLQDRGSWGNTFVQEVVKLVSTSTLLRKEDFDAYYRFLFITTFTETTAQGSTSQEVNIYDFLDNDHTPRQASASNEVKYIHKCLSSLRKQLHDSQAANIRSRFNLSPTALVVRQFTRGHTDQVIKSTDRNTVNLGQVLTEYKSGAELSLAFLRLKGEVEEARPTPLSRLNTLLREVKGKAPRGDGAPVIEFWTRQFDNIAEQLKVRSPGDRPSVEVGGSKRKAEEMDEPVQAARKRVKVETTEVKYTMTVKTAVEYEENDQENAALK